MNVIESVGKKWPEVFTQDWVNSNSALKFNSGIEARKFILKEAHNLCNSCTDCALNINRYNGAVFGDGVIDAPIFIIGEGPGQWEQRTLLPFVYTREFKVSRCNVNCPNRNLCYPPEVLTQHRQLPDRGCVYDTLDKLPFNEVKDRFREPLIIPNTTSTYLDTIVKDLFWRNSWNVGMKIAGKETKPSSLYITNVVKCRSYTESKDAPPTIKCRQACKKWLDMQLFTVRPKVVIILGGIAGATVVSKDFKITQYAGRFNTADAKQLGLPSSVKYIGYGFHPSAIGRDPIIENKEAKINQIRYILEEAKKVC